MRVPIYTYRGQHIHIRYSGAQQTSHIENSVTLEAISSLDEWGMGKILCGWEMSSQWCQVENASSEEIAHY